MSVLKKQFYFLHIPKTAGTTVSLILSRIFKGQKILSNYTPKGKKKHSTLSPDYKNNYDLSYGHMPFNANEHLERGIEYFTFLRSPREHLLSGYKHLKGSGNSQIKKKMDVSTLKLKDFLSKGHIKNLDNIAVRFLSGNTEKPFLTINDSDLKLALENFNNHFSVFGITEYFDESLVLLADYMNWPVLYYLKENKSSYQIDSNELDQETEQLIIACTKYDEVLYTHALNIFQSKIELKKDVIATGLKALEVENKKHRNELIFSNTGRLLVAYIKRKLNQ